MNFSTCSSSRRKTKLCGLVKIYHEEKGSSRDIGFLYAEANVRRIEKHDLSRGGKKSSSRARVFSRDIFPLSGKIEREREKKIALFLVPLEFLAFSKG